MCIICVKPANVNVPTRETVAQMCRRNGDGFGVVYIENGHLVLRKTMETEKYQKIVRQIPKESPAILHMRIATHGSVSKKNCHPFLSEGGKWAFAHNGILSIQNEKDMTDSETFFKRIAMPFINKGLIPSTPAFDAMVETIIGTSKFAFLNESGFLQMYGHFIHDEETGLYFSNETYKTYTFHPSSKWNYPTYGGYYGGYYGGASSYLDWGDDEWDYDYGTNKKGNGKVEKVEDKKSSKNKEVEYDDEVFEDAYDTVLSQIEDGWSKDEIRDTFLYYYGGYPDIVEMFDLIYEECYRDVEADMNKIGLSCLN